MASFCSLGSVFGLVGIAVGADSDEGISGSIDAVGACFAAVGSKEWETVDGCVPSCMVACCDSASRCAWGTTTGSVEVMTGPKTGAGSPRA